MRRDEIERLADESVAAALEPLGFRLDRGNELIVKATSAGAVSVSIAVTDYRPIYELGVNSLIRIDAVEDVFHRFWKVPQSFHRQGWTVNTPSEFLGGPEEWEGSDETTIRGAVEDLTRFVVDRMLPHFERYKDLPAIDRAMNVDRLVGFDITFPRDHASHAVIVARLVSNPRFDDLVREYQAALVAIPAQERSRFNELVAHLRLSGP